MTAIKKLVTRFISNDSYTDWDHEIAQKWMEATRCGEIDACIMTTPEESLSDDESKQLERIKAKTLEFIRLYFNDRPNVARSLDSLFAELGMDNETIRRREFLPFERLYSHDEVMVLLLKHLQQASEDVRYTRESIAKYFLTSDRTINEYIREMQPTANHELSAKVLGQIVQMDTRRRTNFLESTTHPLFLPLSMVELYTLVDMLVKHVNDPIEGRIVESLLGRVLDQTTGYAEERLGHIEGFAEAQASITHLDNRRSNNEAVMFHEKEGIRATVRYVENEEEKSCTGYISRNHRDKTIVDVTGRDEVFHIPFKDIINLESAHE